MSKKDQDKSNQPKNTNRRKLLKHGAVATGGLAAFAAGYKDNLVKAVHGFTRGSAGEVPKHATRGNSLLPEFKIDPETGKFSTLNNQVVSPSTCLGCWTQCGVRVRVDTEQNKIIRIAGNPYHPLATTNPASMSRSIEDVYSSLAVETGLEGRATSCARGSAMQEQVNNPNRVLKPLKRVGKRGEGKWESISFEQLIKEVTEGGDLFGEGHVDGLAALFDHDTLIDSKNPEYGPISNQFLFTDSANEGRTPLVRRFAQQSFGTVNWSNHGSYCGQSYRVGIGMTLGDVWGMPHAKPDWSNCRFGLFMGTSPAQSGNPFQRQGRELAESRTRKEEAMQYVVVSPVLPTSSNLSSANNRWIPIKPATDLALAMGLIRWILENKRFDLKNLAQPGPAAMEKAEEYSWCNATHLLIDDKEHSRYGTFLRASDLGWSEDKLGEDTEADKVFVVQLADGSLAPHTIDQAAEVFVDTKVEVDQLSESPIAVCSSLSKLLKESQKKSFEEYSELCGVPVGEIKKLAKELTSYGKYAAVNSHGGTMSGSGFYSAYAITMLNTLLGNLNVKGGAIMDEGPFGPFGPGPRYDFRFKANPPKGLALSRQKQKYEASSEYKRRIEAGENPYPAPAQWYPNVGGGISSEMIASGIGGYPYQTKVWFNHASNPIYAINGYQNALKDDFCDPKKVPLIVSINPFINETSALADYIVPDTLTYESWGINAPWADTISKASSCRWPVIQPKVEKTPEGEPINLESFLIAVAKQIGMPGFGDKALGDAQDEDKRYDLNTASDFFLRGFANIAYGMKRPVDDASDDDIRITGLTPYLDLIKDKVKEEEWRKTAMIMTRGGRFDDKEQAWDDEKGRTKTPYHEMLTIWNEGLYKTKHAFTGENNSGCPTWYPTRLADGSDMRSHFDEEKWPFLVTSYKSNIMSSIATPVARIRQVHPHNPISINTEDAKALGIKNGTKIRIVSPGGSVDGVAFVRDGMIKGGIAIEHGYGHTELGVKSHIIDGEETTKDKSIGRGVNFNHLGFADSTREAYTGVWIDWISGAAVRQGLPAKIEVI